MPLTLPTTAVGTAGRAELDMNTSPEYDGLLPHDTLPSLLQELIDLAAELAESGDVP